MNAFKNYTGLTNDEMATFLGVHRSQWSMFVSGKRSLPLEATLKLNELLHYVQKNSVNKTNRIFIENESKTVKNELEKKLMNLEIMLYQVNKKIEEVKNTREQLFSGKTALEFFKTKKNINNSQIRTIENRIKKSLEYNSLKNLESLELKKQQIENEIALIKIKLKVQNI
jgi:plasmid maintenance system antidote protein VapI